MNEKDVLENAVMQLNAQNEIITKSEDTIKNLLSLLDSKNAELEITRPKAENYDEFVSADGYLSMKDVSDILALKIEYKDSVKIASRNQILDALVQSGNIQKSFNGYKCLQYGRDHGLLVRTKIANGREYTVVLAERTALEYINKLMKKTYKVVA